MTTQALSRQQVRQLDRFAIETLGIDGVVLMENAGRNVADAACELLGDPAGRAVAIVAGRGNNGGDGFVVGRHLSLRGAKVVTFLICPPEKISGDAAVNLKIIRALGHDIRQVCGEALSGLSAALGQFDLIVDAVGGTGIIGELRGDLAEAVRGINAAARCVLAIDIPTGLDCDTGRAVGPVVKATMTVTFVARKKGFDSPGSDRYTGRITVADIGIPPQIIAKLAAEHSKQ